MQPLSEEEKAAILEAHPEAAPDEIGADIDEYEQLLANRFAVDPDRPPAEPGPFAVRAGEPRPAARLRELHSKLFGSGE
jgi:hypothetical protein